MKITKNIEVTIDVHKNKRYCGKCQFLNDEDVLYSYCSLTGNKDVELILEETPTKSKINAYYEYVRSNECVKLFSEVK
jgi:hypothetical protein